MDKQKAKGLLEKYGYNTVSFQTLMEGLNYFQSSKGIEGYIAYTQIGDVMIAAGDPICPLEKAMELSHEFRIYCKTKKAICLFISVSLEMQKYFELMGFGSIKIGEEGILSLQNFTLEGSKFKDIRNLVNSAKRNGVVTSVVNDAEDIAMSSISGLCEDWLTTRKVHGFSFLLTLDPLENFKDKVVVVAKHEGRVVGYASCVPIYSRNGYYIDDLIRSKKAPAGTNHLLVYELLNLLKLKGALLATLGTSPLGNIDKNDNPEYPNLNKMFKMVYSNFNGFYNFKGLHNFKASFNPSHWEDKFLCFYPPELKPKIILSIIKAYNPSGISGLLTSKFKKTLKKILHAD